MNFTHLAAFHAVAEAGSVSAGSQRLHVSQPAMTREIRELEARLGVALFDRLARGMALTEAGRLLHGYATRIFALANAAEASVQELVTLGIGRLAVGASSTLGVYWLPALLGVFHERYPGVELSLKVTNTAQVEAALLDHSLNLGVVEGPYHASAFAAQLIGNDEIIAVASPQHALSRASTLSLHDLAERVVLMREQGSGTRAVIEAAYQMAGVSIVPALSVGNTEVIKQMLLCGTHVAWMPRLSVEKEVARRQLCVLPVQDCTIHRPFTLLWLKGYAFSPSATAFHALLQDHFIASSTR